MIRKITQNILSLVTHEQIFVCLGEISPVDIEKIVMGMQKDKSPTLDGFAGDFFQTC